MSVDALPGQALLPMPMAPPPGKASDVAYTPPEVARALVDDLGRRYCLGSTPLTMWEPWCGAGAFSEAWAHARPWDKVVASDIDPGASLVVRKRAALRDAFDGPPDGGISWTVSNPPFSRFDDCLRLALEHSRVGVAMLLVGQSMAPIARDWMWTESPPDSMTWLTPRISFDRPHAEKKGQTDMREYAFMVWLRRGGKWHGRMRLGRLNWRTGQSWGRT